MDGVAFHLDKGDRRKSRYRLIMLLFMYIEFQSVTEDFKNRFQMDIKLQTPEEIQVKDIKQ